MEAEMRSNLIRLAQGYADARGIGLPTIGRLAAGDWRFFERIQDGAKTFTARKYDDVVAFFSVHWPGDAEWPGGIERPVVSRETEKSDSEPAHS